MSSSSVMRLKRTSVCLLGAVALTAGASLACLVASDVLGESDDTESALVVSPRQLTERHRAKRQVVDTYYDFLINEWSFKFWAVFQLVTIAVLLYSTFAAIYYAKYTYLHTTPTDEDIFFRKRSLDAAIERWSKENREYKPSERNK